MALNGFNDAVLVSDPLHLRRAAAMADRLGIDAVTSPTPTTRYKSLPKKLGFLFREVLFYQFFLLTGR